MDRLKASPVGEKPSGDSKTSAPLSRACRIASDSTLRTIPVCSKSIPSTMPTGRAVTKFPLIKRMRALPIGVFGRPAENAASISSRNSPEASLAHSSDGLSVMRRPWLKRLSICRRSSCSCTCGRLPWTKTIRIPIAAKSATSWARLSSSPAFTSSPGKPMTKVLLRKA